jgi:Xaa-Pro aminopeptidase
LRLNEPIIVDIFPLNTSTRYWGDCTRTFLRGTPDPRLAHMHALVVRAKAAAIAAAKANAPGSRVHQAVLDIFKPAGIFIGTPPDDAPDDTIFYPHGTGHGIGLECHEAPILDERCPNLVIGDALTIEPGLYCKSIGGVRVEDMIIVRNDGVENLNNLPQGFWWD